LEFDLATTIGLREWHVRDILALQHLKA